MDRKEELRQIISTAKETLSVANKELTDILLTEGLAVSEFKVGDRVLRYGKEYELVGAKLKWNGAGWDGRLVLKDGSLGKQVFEMYGKLTKI